MQEVIIVTRLLAEQHRVRFRASERNSLFSKASRPVVGPKKLPSQGVPGIRYQAVKQPGGEGDRPLNVNE